MYSQKVCYLRNFHFEMFMSEDAVKMRSAYPGRLIYIVDHGWSCSET